MSNSLADLERNWLTTALNLPASSSLSMADLQRLFYSGGQLSGALIAPAPSGDRATDTAAVQPLVDQAQAQGGTVLFMWPGTYKLDIVTLKQNRQAKIISLARNVWDGTLVVNGISGKMSQGFLYGFDFSGSHAGQVALELVGVCNYRWSNLTFNNTYDNAILFHNKNTGDYTEYCRGDADFHGNAISLEYRVTSGDASFNGSGLTEGSTLNQESNDTVAKIKIGANARPYNAPLSVAVWLRNAIPLINNAGINSIHFFGNLRVESFSGPSVSTICSGNKLVLAGTVNLFDEAISLGTLVTVETARSDSSLATVTGSSNSTKDSINRFKLKPDIALAETIPRTSPMASATALVSGRIYCQAILLEEGQTINSITWISAGQAIVAPTNQWFGLFDSNRNKLVLTNDDTNASWNGQTVKTLNLSAPYTVPVGAGGLYYISCCVVAGTANNLQGYNSNPVVGNLSPRLSGTANTGLTNPASCPSTLSAFSDIPVLCYGYVS